MKNLGNENDRLGEEIKKSILSLIARLGGPVASAIYELVQKKEFRAALAKALKNISPLQTFVDVSDIVQAIGQHERNSQTMRDIQPKLDKAYNRRFEISALLTRFKGEAEARNCKTIPDK